MLPVEDRNKPYENLMDLMDDFCSKFGERKALECLKAYMIDVLLATQIVLPSDIVDALNIVRKTSVGEAIDQNEELKIMCWRFLRSSGLEYDFTNATSCAIRIILGVIGINMRSSNFSDNYFWFFNFVDQIEQAQNLTVELFDNYFRMNT